MSDILLALWEGYCLIASIFVTPLVVFILAEEKIMKAWRKKK